MKKRSQSAQAEIETLKARLEEAEQTLEAIRSGRVDALIVSAPDGERVFTLQGADHRYRRIVEGMTEGAVIVMPQGVILYANSSFASLVGAPLERVIGSSIQQYVPSAASSVFERLLRDARIGTATAESRLLAGQVEVPVHVSAAAESELALEGICLIVTDLTDAMREAEQRFQFVADMLPQIIWSARPDGGMEYANRRWFELTGLSLEQTRRSRWESVIHPEDASACVDAWRHSVATGELFQVTSRFRRLSDSAYRWHLGRALPQRSAGGEILRWYGTFTDIEDERALGAEAARARDKAQEATRLKDEFLATLSHELRTPLNAILGWGRLLQAGSLGAAQKTRGLDAIVRNAIAQNQLIEDLLDVSRIISGKLRLNVVPTHLAQVIEAALDVVRPAADAKEVSLQLALDADGALISGDAGRLQQVVWNLLANAVKFTGKGGHVHVVLRRDGFHAEIAISDNGAGIATEFIPYVFDRFRQQDGAITRRAGGLGLGLAIVKNIVELHGGTVEARSDGPQKGSTFVVRLPLVASRSTPPPRPSHDPLPAAWPSEVAGLQVLVVDDEADARDLVKMVLEGGDAVVTTAASAHEALDLIRRSKPDVIVSDVGMPGEDGYAFIRKLRAFSGEEGGRTPAVALTAFARPEDRTRALMAGFQTWSTKPIDPQELLVVVANLAGRFS